MTRLLRDEKKKEIKVRDEEGRVEERVWAGGKLGGEIKKEVWQQKYSWWEKNTLWRGRDKRGTRGRQRHIMAKSSKRRK